MLIIQQVFTIFNQHCLAKQKDVYLSFSLYVAS